MTPFARPAEGGTLVYPAAAVDAERADEAGTKQPSLLGMGRRRTSRG
jgi:hypothetical protein